MLSSKVDQIKLYSLIMQINYSLEPLAVVA